ncbi:MAG: hypothetical protein GF331_07715 [Chitinivibrionales bacterium]|nr:hypothetical protein [Chitinivibrionales bacterium]
MARFTHMLRVSIGAGVIVAVGAMAAWAQLEPVNQDFATGLGGSYSCGTWDETEGGEALGSVKFESPDVDNPTSCDG